MQFLAIMKVATTVADEKVQTFNVQETEKSWAMYKSDVMRSLWFIPSEGRPAGTVAVLECASQTEAEAQCRTLPFIENKVADVEIIPLAPCTAYEMLFRPQVTG